jgi:hypothetical protein
MAMGISDDALTVAARPQPQISKGLRRAKLLTAFAIAAIVGLGSYAATYHALVIISVPSNSTGSVVPAPSGTSTTAPGLAPAQPHP